MEAIAPAQAAPSVEEIIEKCGKAISSAMTEELSDTADPDRVFILREIYRSYLYFTGKQNQAPTFFGDLFSATNVNVNGNGQDGGVNSYDYSQNIYRGYARKLEGILGTRMPNAIAVPNNASDASSISVTESANNAALYIRQKADLEMKSLYLIFGLFVFGTNFWHLEWNVDGDKYGYKTVETPGTEQQALGNASYNCPECATAHEADPENPQPPGQCSNCGAPVNESHYAPPSMVDVPTSTVNQVPKGGLEITVHNASEINVPLDALSVNDDTCPWLDYSREVHKGKLLQEFEKEDGSNILRDDKSMNAAAGDNDSGASQYAENIRSAFASPIGLVRPKRNNQWTRRDTWWKPSMYQLIEGKEIRQMLQTNFPTGLRITWVKGKMVDLQEEKLAARWQECKPEPSTRIMTEGLGADWIDAQDLSDNMLNQRNEIVERANEPGFADPTRIDFDAYQNRRELPMELFPALRPAGGSLSDIIYRPPPNQFSEQIAPFCMEIVQTSKNNSGLEDAIWGGGDSEEPTARQAELKKNAALMQLGVIWKMVGKSFEQVYLKACKLLADYEDGVLAFSKKDQFQQYTTLAATVADLRSENYHFEADESPPMTWGQQRDLMMWMLDKPDPLLKRWGFDSPRNIFEFKQLLGMPGEHIPLLDNLKKGMSVIADLLKHSAIPGQIDPTTNQPGPKQSSIQPDWEDDAVFNSQLVMDFLQANPSLKRDNPNGYENVQLYGQAQQARANAPAAPPPPKASLAVSLKGPDLGNSAVQDAVQKLGLIDKGTAVAAVSPPPKLMDVPSTTAQAAAEHLAAIPPPPPPVSNVPIQ